MKTFWRVQNQKPLSGPRKNLKISKFQHNLRHPINVGLLGGLKGIKDSKTYQMDPHNLGEYGFMIFEPKIALFYEIIGEC